MHGVRTLCVALSSVAMLTCCAPRPVKISAGDHCFGCRRYIRNERLAAETISGDKARFIAKFRGPGCLAKHLADHPGEDSVIYVTDYSSGKMMRPGGAFFVSEVQNRETGESEYRSYRNEDDARTAAAELKAAVLSWDEVLEKAR